MATRFYLPSTGTASSSPTLLGTWTEKTGTAHTVLKIDKVATKISSAATNIVDSSSAYGATTYVIFQRYMIGPVNSFTIADTDTWASSIECGASAASNTRVMVIGIRAIAADGTTVSFAVLNPDGTQDDTVFTSPGQSSRYKGDWPSFGIGTVVQGGYIELALGFRETSASAFTTTMVFGDDAGVDLDAADADTVGDPWFEYSGTITMAPTGPNNQLMMTGIGK